MMMTLLWATAALAVQQPATDDEGCRAAPAQVLVGERYRRHLPTRAKRLSGAKTVRRVDPGQLTTMDYRADRVNIRVDHLRRVTAITCG